MTRVGIVGLGGIASYHIEGFRAAGAEVVAGCDASAELARAGAKTYDISRSYPSLEAMLEGESGLDAVSICTPNRFHAEQAETAAAAGKHVFCEKPPAMDATGARRMAAAAQTAGVHLMFDFNNRARPEAEALKAYIDDGTVGAIHSAQAWWIRRCGIPGYGGWFTQKALSGGGPAIDLLHMLDLALWFMDYPDPAWVLGTAYSDFAHDRSFAGPWGLPSIADGTMDVETSTHALVTFSTGQAIHARMSWAEMNEREEVSCTFQGARAGGRICRLFGVDGLDETSMDSCELFTHEGGRAVNRDVVCNPDPSMGRLAMARNFIEAIEGTAKPLSTAAEGVELMQIIEALYRSAETGAPVEVAKI